MAKIKWHIRKNNAYAGLDPDEIFADSVTALHVVETSEGKIEKPISFISYILLLTSIVVGMGYLTTRAASVQLASGDTYFTQSQKNRFVTRPILPPRGIIYDNSHAPLVDNVPSFDIVFEKNEFLQANGNLHETLSSLATTLQKPLSFFYEAGFPDTEDVTRTPSRVIIIKGLSQDDFLSYASQLNGLPGIQIIESFRRVYHSPLALSHLVGYIGKISDQDVVSDPTLNDYTTIGKSGIEAMYDQRIRGISGKKIVEITAAGKETQFKLLENPTPGDDITLTIDTALQQRAYDMLQHYSGNVHGGSVVMMDPRDGSIRALVSFPGFNTNAFSTSLTQKEFQRTLNDPLKPLFNRAIAGEFPSGSTIKPMMAAAALQEHIIDPHKKIYDEGFIEIPNPYHPDQKSVFVDWRKQGWINLYDAIAWSANVYFYTIGGGYKDQKGLGIEKIKQYALAFGLGAKLGIDLPGEHAGFIPDENAKKTLEPSDPIWRVGDTYNVSIGQGGVRATPLQMAALTSVIASGGTLYQPHIIQRDPTIIRSNIVGKDAIRDVVQGMTQTVTSGTARMFQNVGVSVAAKTGTAQAGAGLPHAWVTAFAPADKPEIVIAAMVEHAGEGSTVAVPIADDLLQWYFLHKNLTP